MYFQNRRMVALLNNATHMRPAQTQILPKRVET